MNPNREEALFALALEKPVEKRPAFLDAICEGDAALRAHLEALLAAHEQPETLLATQPETARPTLKLDLADAPDEAVGQTLGRYKLREKIGEGGCGTVYVAELPDWLIREDLLSGRLVRVLPQWNAKDLPIHVVHAGQRLLPTRVSNFIDFAVSYMKKELASNT